MIIEIVDTEAAIEAFVPVLDAMVTEGMITLEKVQVVRYRGRESS
jgi:PII-like signaling protein